MKITIEATSIDQYYKDKQDNSECRISGTYIFENILPETLIIDLIKERIKFYKKCTNRSLGFNLNIENIVLSQNKKIIPIDIPVSLVNGSFDLIQATNSHEIYTLNYLIKNSINNLLDLNLKLDKNIFYLTPDLKKTYLVKEITVKIIKHTSDPNPIETELKILNSITIEQLIDKYDPRNKSATEDKTQLFHKNNPDINIPHHLTVAQAQIKDGQKLISYFDKYNDINLHIQNIHKDIDKEKREINKYFSYWS
jgi:hypothetical protein